MDSIQDRVINDISNEYAKGHSYTEQYVIAHNHFVDSLSFDGDDSYKIYKLKLDYLNDLALREMLLKNGYKVDAITNKYVIDNSKK